LGDCYDFTDAILFLSVAGCSILEDSEPIKTDQGPREEEEPGSCRGNAEVDVLEACG
jgi:hypothetical protein